MITDQAIAAARAGLRGVVVPTPLLPSARLSEEFGGPVFVKAENTQRGGSFKLRGAYTKLAALTTEERRRGVLAASAGNHAQGVALAAGLLGAPATVVMPVDAPLTKVSATRRAGAQVILHGAAFDDAVAHARRLQAARGLTVVHAFDDPLVVAGQGTVGLEILDALPDLGTVVVPVGGGGLIGGIATVVRARRPGARVIGVQAAACPSVPLSLAAGRPVLAPPPRTIADGIAVKQPGAVTLPLIQTLVDEVVTVEEGAIARAIVYALQHLGLVVEGAGAVSLAALLEGRVRPRPPAPLCVVLSGGNIDANLLARVIDQVLVEQGRYLVEQGRYLVVQTAVPDRPGNLARLAEQLAAAGANVLDIHHRRAAWGVPLARTGLELLLEVRDEEHAQQVLQHLHAAGYELARVPASAYPG